MTSSQRMSVTIALTILVSAFALATAQSTKQRLDEIDQRVGEVLTSQADIFARVAAIGSTLADGPPGITCSCILPLGSGRHCGDISPAGLRYSAPLDASQVVYFGTSNSSDSLLFPNTFNVSKGSGFVYQHQSIGVMAVSVSDASAHLFGRFIVWDGHRCAFYVPNAQSISDVSSAFEHITPMPGLPSSTGIFALTV